MPDTGAPWNIPYVEATDLVSDWPADSLALANAIDAGLDAAAIAGIGSNVVSTAKTDVFTTTSTSFTAVTGLTATITPTSATAKVLVVVQIGWGHNVTNPGAVAWRLTGGNAANYIADTAGSRTRAVFGGVTTSTWGPGNYISPGSIVYLDSPATTSATTYGVEVRSPAAAAVFVNQNTFVDTDSADTARGASSITVIEVAA